MTLKIGIDVRGTFTDFVVTRDGAESLHTAPRGPFHVGG